MNRNAVVYGLVYALALSLAVALLFILHRFLFLFCFDRLHAAAIIRVAVHSLKLDVSTLSYLFIACLAGGLLRFVLGQRGTFILGNVFAAVVLLLVNTVAVADVFLYREWHSRINWGGLQHLANPSEVFQTVSSGTLLIFLGAVLGLSIAFWYLFNGLRTFFFVRLQFLSHEGKWLLVTYIIMLPLLVIGCRGGLQPIPVGVSDAYFASDQVLNDAAVNPLWNLGYIIIEARARNRAEKFVTMPSEEALQLTADYVPAQNDTAPSILTTTRPNIIVVVLEGWSANAMGFTGAVSHTPNFDRYAGEGILCTNAYAAAYLSDMGNAAIFSGFPGIRSIFINHEPAKAAKIPSLFKSLKPMGYSCAYFFGGQLSYGNIKSYLLLQGVDRVVEQQDFPSSFPSGRLGIHDGFTLPYFLGEINKAKAPFLYSIFTGSTHSPYDFPGAGKSAVRSDYDYLASMNYADSVLGVFMADAKKQSWYDSTLIIIVSDHSHGTPDFVSPHLPVFHRIPMLLTGGAIHSAHRGKRVDKLVSQVDLATTVLNQMKQPVNEYKWGADFLKPGGRSWGFLPYHNGGILLQGDSFVSLNSKSAKVGDSNVKNEDLRNALLHKAKAFQQQVYQAYEQW